MRRAPPNRPRTGAPSGEAGFTIVEVVVAAVVLVLGMLATFGMLQAATRNTERAKGTQIALDRAQQELESLHSLTEDKLAMTATPPHSTDPMNPDYRVSNGTFAMTRRDPSTQQPSNYATMVVNGGSLVGNGTGSSVISGGTVDPGPTPFTSGSVSGRIYRYIVWRNDPNCPTTSCNGTQDFKQVIVAVKLDDQGGGRRGYVEVQSDFINPNDSTLTEPTPGSNGVVTAQQFYLSDTPCDPSANGTTTTQRQDITGDHLLHNTFGTCASGLQNGSVAGAPDVLLTGAPPDPSPQDPNAPPLYDYSNDFYLEPSPDTDKGVQIRREDTTGCNYNPTGTANPESQVHRWVTDPMSSDFTLNGKVTLEFYTRTINDSLHTGRACVYLFKRSEAGSPPVATDLQITSTGGGNCSAGASYWCWQPAGDGNWPRFAWTKERLTMSFSSSTIPKIPVGQRLGVALSVDRAITPADAIPFLYDHPTYPSRLEVDTTTPLGG